MGEGYNFKLLQENILALSSASDWETARKEWKLIDIMEVDEPETCLCGHFPIIEVCTIKNNVTGNVADVGNRCVKRFLGFRSDLIFTAIKKIRKDNTKSLNAGAIAFFMSMNAISKWEYGFLQYTMRKRELSNKQLETRVKINNKILTLMERKGVRDANVIND